MVHICADVVCVGVSVYGCASRHCCFSWDVEPPVIRDIHYNHGGVLNNDFNSFLISRYWNREYPLCSELVRYFCSVE